MPLQHTHVLQLAAAATLGGLTAYIIMNYDTFRRRVKKHRRSHNNKKVEIYFSGFDKKVKAVTGSLGSSNTTYELIKALPEVFQHKPVDDVDILGYNTIENSGNTVYREVPVMHFTLQQNRTPADSKNENRLPRQVIIHLAVAADSKEKAFRLERLALNDASFSTPDDREWKPSHSAVVSKAPVGTLLATKIPIDDVAENLTDKGWCVKVSNHPSGELSNYAYYRSLWEGRTSGVEVLLVHVPSLDLVPIKNQRNFVRALVEAIRNRLA